MLQRVNTLSGGTIYRGVSLHVRMRCMNYFTSHARGVARVGIYEMGVIQENAAGVAGRINGINVIPVEYA